MKMNLLGKQQPYQHRSDLGKPKKVPWPPYNYHSEGDTLSIRTDITSLYKSIYQQLFTHIAKTGEVALLRNTELFAFHEVLAYGAVLGHLGLLNQTFSNLEERIRTTFRTILEADKQARFANQRDPTQPRPDPQPMECLDFITVQGADHFESCYHLVEDLVVLYKLECDPKADNKKIALEDWFSRSGKVLARPDGHPDVLTAYAASPAREYVIMKALCSRAKAEIEYYIQTTDYTRTDLLLTICTFIHRFAALPRLQQETKDTVISLIAKLRTNFEGKGITPTEEMDKLLSDALTLCRQ
jgi:hypothetical protein